MSTINIAPIAMAVAAGLLAVLAVAAAGVLGNEASGSMGSLARAIVRGAARLIPDQARERYRSDWLADLAALEGRPISMLLWAAWTPAAAWKEGRSLARSIAQQAAASALLDAGPSHFVVNTAVRRAKALNIPRHLVLGCLDLTDINDQRFNDAWGNGIDALEPHQRGGALPGVTGHVAESVAEIVLSDSGYHPMWHFTGPDRSAFDLLMLSPNADHVVAVGVKGTLCAGRVPRVSPQAVEQMGAAWFDETGTAHWGLQSTPVYGAVVAVNLGDMTLRAALSTDFERWRPVRSLSELGHIAES